MHIVFNMMSFLSIGSALVGALHNEGARMKPFLQFSRRGAGREGEVFRVGGARPGCLETTVLKAAYRDHGRAQPSVGKVVDVLFAHCLLVMNPCVIRCTLFLGLQVFLACSLLSSLPPLTRTPLYLTTCLASFL